MGEGEWSRRGCLMVIEVKGTAGHDSMQASGTRGVRDVQVKGHASYEFMIGVGMAGAFGSFGSRDMTTYQNRYVNKICYLSDNLWDRFVGHISNLSDRHIFCRTYKK